MITEKEKYFKYIKEQYTKGLISESYTLSTLNSLVNINAEDFYAELNRMNTAPDLEDREVLGEYSSFKIK